jgi:hypothetical protein
MRGPDDSLNRIRESRRLVRESRNDLRRAAGRFPDLEETLTPEKRRPG